MMGIARTKKLRLRMLALMAISLIIIAYISLSKHKKSSNGGSSTIKPTVSNELINAILPMMRSHHPPYKMIVCGIFRNEAKNIAQWILYHYLLGVQHFYLLDNGSEDKSAAMLQPFIDMGLVTYYDWSGDYHRMLGRQTGFCSNSTMFAPITEWGGMYDVDEYIVMPGWEFNENIFLDKDTTTFPLHRFLNEYKGSGCGGVWLDRMNFDCNGHEKRPNGLVMNEFTTRVLSVKYPHAAGKNIVLYEGLDRLTGGHSFRPKDGWHVCFADFRRMQTPFENISEHVYEPIRINHYVSLSYNECMGKIEALKKRNSEIVDWRIIQGQKLCDRHMVGTELYVKEEHVQDRTLADSMYPVVVNQLLDKIYTGYDVGNESNGEGLYLFT